MDDKIKFFIMGFAVCFTGMFFYLHCLGNDDRVVSVVKTPEAIQQAAQNKGIVVDKQQLKCAKQTDTVQTTVGELYQTAQVQQKTNGSVLAPVLGDVSGKSDDKAVELQQYHIYAAPKILYEVGLKLDNNDKVRGLSYGIKRRIKAKGQYVGVRVDYDWKEKQAALWATYSW